jgi:hypothetical protein
MEPEQPIEKTLRTAAERRRGLAGDAFHLHSADRNRLQREVADTYGRRRSGSTSWIATFWSTCGWGFGVAAGLVFATILMLPRQTQTPRQLAAIRKTELERSASVPVHEVQSGLPVAAAPAATTANGTAKAATFSSAVQTVPSLAAEPPPAASVSGGPTRALAIYDTFTPLGTFASKDTAAVATRSNQIIPLQSFALERSGARLRAIDADGSVYSGSILAQAKDSELELATNGLILDDDVAANKAEKDTWKHSVTFILRGTNRTLNQPVLFSGKLVTPVTSIASGAATVPAQNAPARNENAFGADRSFFAMKSDKAMRRSQAPLASPTRATGATASARERNQPVSQVVSTNGALSTATNSVAAEYPPALGHTRPASTTLKDAQITGQVQVGDRTVPVDARAIRQP